MRKETHSTDIPVGQPADIILPDGAVAVGQQRVEPVHGVLGDEYMDALAFNEDMLEIVVHDGDQNCENPIMVGVNGIYVQIFRGQPTLVRRKFVSQLCAKQTRVSTPEYINGGGERAFKIVQTNTQKYPFSVIKDPSPRGNEWLRRTMAEAV